MSRVYTAESATHGTGVFSSARLGDGETLWDCSCGSPACRRRHFSGFFHLPVEVQARYLALLEDWFVAGHRDEVEALKRRVKAPRAAGSPVGLCTEAARRAETIKWADGRATFRVVPEFVREEWGIDLKLTGQDDAY